MISGEAERSNSYRVETPGSNPIHVYNFLFPYFLGYHKSWDTVSQVNDNSKLKANYELTIIVNLEKISCCSSRGFKPRPHRWEATALTKLISSYLRKVVAVYRCTVQENCTQAFWTSVLNIP